MLKLSTQKLHCVIIVLLMLQLRALRVGLPGQMVWSDGNQEWILQPASLVMFWLVKWESMFQL